MFNAFLAAAAVTAPIPATTTDWWSDYYDRPGQGLTRGELSVVVAEITVNTRGYFAGCVGRVYAGNPQMGPYVCGRLKMRAEFEPARGPDGRKITGIYRKLIIVANVNKETQFRAPDFGIRIAARPGDAKDNPFEIQFYLDASGKVSDCSLVDSVGLNLAKHKQVVDPALVQLACGEIPNQLKPLPPRDTHGNPFPTVQNALVITGGLSDLHNQDR
jgi:hypothetical protein